MNKSAVVDSIANHSGLKRVDSERALRSFIDTVVDALKKGESVSLVGFGTFQVRHRAAREGRNPQTGETIRIAAARVPAFKPSGTLKRLVDS